jgi:hypothetical protein
MSKMPSDLTDASVTVVRMLRTDRVSYCSFQKTLRIDVASQVYYAPLIILAELNRPN